MSEGTSRPLSRTEIREIVVGVLAILAFFALAGGSYARGQMEDGVGDGSYRLYATFGQVNGLAVGDDVMVSGIPYGRVLAMTLNDNFSARVTMSMDNSVKLPKDSSAAVHTDGLFGSKFVVIVPGADEATLGDGGIITYTQDPIVVEQLLDLIISEGRAARAQDAKAPQ